MPLIAATVEPDGVARIFFDMREAAPAPDDQARIIRVIEATQALAEPATSIAPLPRAA